MSTTQMPQMACNGCFAEWGNHFSDSLCTPNSEKKRAEVGRSGNERKTGTLVGLLYNGHKDERARAGT